MRRGHAVFLPDVWFQKLKARPLVIFLPKTWLMTTTVGPLHSKRRTWPYIVHVVTGQTPIWPVLTVLRTTLQPKLELESKFLKWGHLCFPSSVLSLVLVNRWANAGWAICYPQTGFVKPGKGQYNLFSFPIIHHTWARLRLWAPLAKSSHTHWFGFQSFNMNFSKISLPKPKQEIFRSERACPHLAKGLKVHARITHVMERAIIVWIL